MTSVDLNYVQFWVPHSDLLLYKQGTDGPATLEDDKSHDPTSLPQGLSQASLSSPRDYLLVSSSFSMQMH
jgi:hypothetical protein